ncbi:MAG TPA: DoxX family protein [Bacteroidia bacterium]|nr:DoxX family protein [Bacteroidota bacterium]HMT29636.1 DoxX family protein [Bacteroidia bacterium]
MRPFPFVSRCYWHRVLRVILGLSMAAHGVYRIVEVGMSNFGEFLTMEGFPMGFTLGWLVTIFEIAGGLTLALAYFRRPLCAAFIFELLIGILLVHASNGWFVVGSSSGGAEYNTLLIICFSLVASDD